MTKNDLKTAKRLMKYVTEKYKFQFILVFFCILISAVATTAVSLSLRYLLDDFILPLIGQKQPDFAGLYKALSVLGCIFLAGVAATFIYTRMMVYIGQGVLKRVFASVRFRNAKTDTAVVSAATATLARLMYSIFFSILQTFRYVFTSSVFFAA